LNDKKKEGVITIAIGDGKTLEWRLAGQYRFWNPTFQAANHCGKNR